MDEGMAIEEVMSEVERIVSFCAQRYEGPEGDGRQCHIRPGTRFGQLRGRRMASTMTLSELQRITAHGAFERAGQDAAGKRLARLAY